MAARSLPWVLDMGATDRSRHNLGTAGVSTGIARVCRTGTNAERRVYAHGQPVLVASTSLTKALQRRCKRLNEGDSLAY